MNQNAEEPKPVQSLPLDKAAEQLLEECRMVLPGIQALFGFQLVAVFSSAFSERLSASEQLAHLAAILCVILAVALVMAPAALHRVREPMSVSFEFVRISSRLLMLSMAPLACGTIIDLFLVAHVLTRNLAGATAAAAFGTATFFGLWIALPRLARLESAKSRDMD